MYLIRNFCVGVILLFLALNLSCAPSTCLYENPDKARFNHLVLSSALQDSLQHNVITIGMPYFVVQQVFQNCSEDTAIPVASIGSRQKLVERQGLYSRSHDPDIEIYLAEYRTAKGMLRVWYRDPDFYRLKSVSGDRILLFGLDQIDTAVILSLAGPLKLRISKNLKEATIPYAEILHKNPVGKRTSWYHLTVSDSTVILGDQVRSEYPIFRLELNDNSITSFRWK